MRIVLQDFYYGSKRIFLETSFDEMDNAGLGDPTGAPCGIGYEIGGNLVGLFELKGKLFLFLNGQASEVREGRITARFSQGVDRDRLLTLVIDGTAVDIPYTVLNEPVSTPFYSETEYDVDFGLWLSKIINEPERRRNFTEGWRDH